MTALQPPRSQLYSRWDHQTGSDALLVYFNGYGSPAKGVATRLQNFGWLSAYGTSTLWFAEAGELGWYTEFDRRIQATVRFAIAGHGIRRVLFMGSSAGAYAALRHAALIDDIDADLRAVRALAINPQTGFDAGLFDAIRGGLVHAGRAAAELGADPIVPAPGRIPADSALLASADLKLLLAAAERRQHATELHVVFDTENPIDHGFATRLAGARDVHLHGVALGMKHAEGGGVLLKSDAVKAAAEAALGIAIPVASEAPSVLPADPPEAARASSVHDTGRVHARPEQGSTMKPYLALFRTGAQSLHAHAVERLDEQSFDYALSHFGDDEPMSRGAVFVHRQKGAKWPGLEQTIRAHWDTIQRYKFVWLPDDDLLCVPEDVSRMFAICDDLQLELAQPALTLDSYYSHVITMQHSAFQLRFTNFVEIMAPVLSIDMLSRVYPTLAGNISGFGLDALWPRLSKLGKVAIIDDTPVKHTRPVGGPNYKFSKDIGIMPAHEDWLVSAGSFIETPCDFHINLAGLLQTGDPICIGTTGSEINVVLQALMDSTANIKVSALYLTRYLSNHFNFWSGGGSGQVRYPRALLRLVLNRTLKHAGIRFTGPEDAVAASTAPVDTAAAEAEAEAVLEAAIDTAETQAA